jgi:hypothetical protein
LNADDFTWKNYTIRCASIPCWAYICISCLTLQYTCSCYSSWICRCI